MTKPSQNRLIRLMMLLMLLMTITSLMAQDAPTETPADVVVTVLPAIELENTPLPLPTVEVLPPVLPTVEVLPSALPTVEVLPSALPTEIAAPTIEGKIITPIASETAVTLAAPVEDLLTPEPALTLLVRDLFQDAAGEPILSPNWSLPTGWTLVSTANGAAVQISAANAGVSSTLPFGSDYSNVAAMGYFTFVDQMGSAAVSVRESISGAYVATLNANGLVTLEKRDPLGAVMVLSSASVPVLNTARGLRLSAIGDVLRVSVDNSAVIAVQDASPLPIGGVSIGAAFPPAADGQTLSGTILFDDFFLWTPAGEAVPVAPTVETPVTPATLPTVVTAPIETVVVVEPVNPGGKSRVPRSAPFVMGVLSSGNDDFASRNVVTATPYGHNGDTIGNSVEVDEISPACGFNITNTAWYEFTPPTVGAASEVYTITSLGSNFDTMIAVYTDSNGGAANLADLVPLANGCSDDLPSGSQQASLAIPLVDATTYFIQLGGYNGSVGNFSFAILTAPDLAVPPVPAISLTAAGAPTTPVGNTAKTNLVQPVLAWTAAAVPAYGYRIEVATTANFGVSIVASDVVLDPTRFYQVPTLPVPALAAGQVYYWHVRAENFLGQSIKWSPTYSFTLDLVAPASPALTAPTLSGIEKTLRPVFKWAASPTAVRYHLQVATNFSCSTLAQSFTSFVFETSNITLLTHTFAADLPQGEYWYCMKAFDAAGNESGFGEKRRFLINVSQSPANNQLIVSPAGTSTANVVLNWTGIIGATYDLEIADDSSFSSGEIFSNLASPTYTQLAKPYGVYYWRVFVKLGANTSALPASLAYRFTVMPPAPLQPTIQTIAPAAGSVANAALTDDTTPLLDWNVPANWVPLPQFQSLTYQFELSTNNTFTLAGLVAPKVTGIPDTHFEWTATTLPATALTTYYWRVRPVTNLGVEGPYSPVYSFKLDTDEPLAPLTLKTPAENAVITTARPVFSWTPATGAKNYRLQIDNTDNTFASLVFDQPVSLTVPAGTYILPQSLPQGTYFWQVWSIDAAGNESLLPSVTGTFTVDYRTGPVANFAAPTTTTASITFSWPLVPSAPLTTTYTIEIDEDLNGSADVTVPPVTTASVIKAGLVQGEYQYRLVVDGGFGTSGWRRFVVSVPLPGAPVVPFTPAAVPTNDTTPTFNWGIPTLNPGGIVDYELQISTVASFDTQIAGSPFIVLPGERPFTLASALPNAAGQIYYWRVRARTGLQSPGPFIVTRSFTLDTEAPPAPTILKLPLDGAVVSTARPVFSWTAVPGAKNYTLQIHTDTDFDDPETLEKTVTLTPTVTSYVLNQSLPQGTYFWRVLSNDAVGNESLVSLVNRSFTIDYRTAPVANFATPTATTANVTFSWTLVASAPVGTLYTIEIDEDLNGSADTVVPAVTTANTTMSGLAQGDYQYRLVVNNDFGASDWRPFFVMPLLPGLPVAPFAPAAGTVTPVSPLLEWGAPTVNDTNVIGYDVQISTVANFATQLAGSPFDVGNVLSYTPTLPNTAGQMYYWRVRAKGQFNQPGNYSATQSFKLDTTVPDDVTLVKTPVDGAITALVRPSFSWGAAGGANGYFFQLTQDSTDFDPLVIPEATTTTPTYVIPAGSYLQQGIYFWQVFAKNAAGQRSLLPSPYYALKVNYSLTPSSNAVIVSAAPTHVSFKWTSVPGTAANSIRVQIDNNDDFSSPERTSPILASTATTYTTSMPGSISMPGSVLDTSPLPHGKYYWRVLVTGNAVLPDYLAFSFTITPNAPPAPVLSTTTPTASTADTTPGFSWTEVASPTGATVTGYELQLSKAASFSPLVDGATINISGASNTTYSWTPVLPDTPKQIYYVRVRAVTNLGARSAWRIRSFTLDTESTGLAAPALIAPANNASVASLKPTFKWGAVLGAARYEIRYGTQADLSAVTPILASTTTHVPPADLTPVKYYWQVRALDPAGNAGPWSLPRVVKIT